MDAEIDEAWAVIVRELHARGVELDPGDDISEAIYDWNDRMDERLNYIRDHDG